MATCVRILPMRVLTEKNNFWLVLAYAKVAFFGYFYWLPKLATLAKQFRETCQTCRHSPSSLASTRQTCRHLPKAIFEKNVTRLDTFTRVMSESREFGSSGHCLNKSHKNVTWLCWWISCCFGLEVVARVQVHLVDPRPEQVVRAGGIVLRILNCRWSVNTGSFTSLVN